MTTRAEQLRAGLAAVTTRIAAACSAADREPEAVTLVAVTKSFPATDVRLLAELGVTDIGENRDQEARRKHAACADLPLRWHFVGQLQTNKARSVAGYADLVHSVDRPALVDALARAAADRGRTVTALVQVALVDDPGRAGVRPGAARGLADAIATRPSLRLGGVMAVAPLGGDAAAAFARLAEVAAAVRADHPTATIISAGMSGDLEVAVRHGATHVRIGTALLGHRASRVG